MSKGTIFDVPGVIGRAKRPIVLVFDGENSIQWEKMDYLTVAIGMINQIQKESKQKISEMPIVRKEQTPSKVVVPSSPSWEMRKTLQPYAVKR